MSQEIKCHVTACRYHDQAQHCTKADITVGNTTPAPNSKCDTECDSFEECC